MLGTYVMNFISGHYDISQQINSKNLRSVVFRNCKNNKLAETICLYLKNKPFGYFMHDVATIKVNFENWIVQIDYG